MGEQSFLIQIKGQAVFVDSRYFTIGLHASRSTAGSKPLEGNIRRVRDRDQVGDAGRRAFRLFPLHGRAGANANLARQLRAGHTENFPRLPDTFPQS